MKQLERVNHTFEPYYNNDSEILILGSMPSKVSRERTFYYMHPANRFWKVLSYVYQEEIGVSIDKKKSFLQKHKIALWDVIESCSIIGSSDNSIKNIIPTDINYILNKTNIKKIYVLGNTAYKYYNKYIYKQINREAILLPSTSSANASWNLEKLVEKFQILTEK